MPDDNKKEVLEAEYVGDSAHEPARSYSYGQYTYREYGNGGDGPHGRTRFTVFRFRDNNRLDACRGMQLANFITMVLFFTCLFQWGFLAALGFAFFYAIAAGAGLYYNTHKLLTGHVPNPWPWRIGSWIVCLALVSWLV